MSHKYSFHLRSEDRRRALPPKVIIGRGDGEGELEVVLRLMGFLLLFRERLQIRPSLHDDSIPFTPDLVESRGRMGADQPLQAAIKHIRSAVPSRAESAGSRARFENLGLKAVHLQIAAAREAGYAAADDADWKLLSGLRAFQGELPFVRIHFDDFALGRFCSPT